MHARDAAEMVRSTAPACMHAMTPPLGDGVGVALSLDRKSCRRSAAVRPIHDWSVGPVRGAVPDRKLCARASHRRPPLRVRHGHHESASPHGRRARRRPAHARATGTARRRRRGRLSAAPDIQRGRRGVLRVFLGDERPAELRPRPAPWRLSEGGTGGAAGPGALRGRGAVPGARFRRSPSWVAERHATSATEDAATRTERRPCIAA